MRIFPEKIKRALKSTLFGLMLAASVTVQSLGAQALGTDSTAAKEETVESPVAMDVVYGYQNTAKSGRFLPLKIELSSQSGQAFNGTLCILAMESDFQGYNMNLDYDVYRYEYPVEIEPGGNVNKSVSISLGARVDQMYVRLLDENGNEVVSKRLKLNLNLHFSISATSRAPRGTEKDGVEYYFLTPDEFRARIAAGDFLEYEEVYTDKYYGTLKSEVERRLMSGDNVIFDVDVVGGCNIKKFYGDRALSVFIQPPSIEDLRSRLEGRGTDAPEVIESRIAKAEFELGFADKFDVIVVNDKLEVAEKEALKVIKEFLKKA